MRRHDGGRDQEDPLRVPGGVDRLACLAGAIQLDESDAQAHVGLSVAYVELNRPGEARKAIDTARGLAAGLPDHDRRHIDARELQMQAEEVPGDAARLDVYRQSLDGSLAAFPKDVEFLLLRGIAESPDPADRGQGSTATAMPYYEKALALVPGHVAAHHYVAHAYENTNRVAQALPHAATFAKGAPAVPHARHMHGHSLWRLGRVFEAIAEFEAADRMHREYAKAEKVPLEADWHVEHNLGLLGRRCRTPVR